MFDLDLGICAFNFYFVKTFFEIFGKISDRKLSIEQNYQILKKRLESDRRGSALKKCATACFVG